MAKLTRADLGELADEAIVDASSEDEQLTALCTMIDDNLALGGPA